MAWDPSHRSPAQTRVLDAALERLRAAGPGALAIFDLDGCLMDNRPRQIHILREYASQHDLPELYAVREEHFVDWSLKRTLALSGLARERITALYPGLHEYWWRCFFSDEYPVHDHAMPGAVPMVRAAHDAGAEVVYLTARHEDVRQGTLGSLRRFGFPCDGPRSHLEMKGDPAVDDDVAKVEAVVRLARAHGDPVLFFDNEPANVNGVHRRFPGATAVFVDTDHSPRPIEPHPALPRIRGFLR